MERNLYFIDSYGKYRLLYKDVEEDRVFKLINSFLNDHKYISYYVRSWETKEGTMYDVGSHTEFFLWGVHND